LSFGERLLEPLLEVAELAFELLLVRFRELAPEVLEHAPILVRGSDLREAERLFHELDPGTVLTVERLAVLVENVDHQLAPPLLRLRSPLRLNTDRAREGRKPVLGQILERFLLHLQHRFGSPAKSVEYLVEHLSSFLRFRFERGTSVGALALGFRAMARNRFGRRKRSGTFRSARRL